MCHGDMPKTAVALLSMKRVWLASLQYAIGIHRDGFDLCAQHDDLTFNSGVSGLGEFETVGAMKDSFARIVTGELQAHSSDSIVKKLQVCFGASLFGGRARDLKDTQAVEPKQGQCNQ